MSLHSLYAKHLVGRKDTITAQAVMSSAFIQKQQKIAFFPFQPIAWKKN